MAAADTGAATSSRSAQVARTIKSLKQALDLLDSLNDHRDLGARLAEIIETLKREQAEPEQ